MPAFLCYSILRKTNNPSKESYQNVLQRFIVAEVHSESE